MPTKTAAKKISITVDGRKIKVPAGTTIMQAAETIGVRIPRLCYHPKLSIEGACRICIVEVKGMKNWVVTRKRPRAWRSPPPRRKSGRPGATSASSSSTTTRGSARRASATATASSRTSAIPWACAIACLKGRARYIRSRIPALRLSAIPRSAFSVSAACVSASRSRGSTTSASTSGASTLW
jgi:hypothetical protein